MTVAARAELRMRAHGLTAGKVLHDLKSAFQEWMHPRGKDGKFIDKGASVNVDEPGSRGDGGKVRRGTITDLTERGPEVKFIDGNKETELIPLADVAQRLTAAPPSVARIDAPGQDGTLSLGRTPITADMWPDMIAVPGSTSAQHMEQLPDGSWDFTAERKRLHDQIMAKHLAMAKKPTGQPQFNVLGGGPAAGKSTIVKSGQIPELVGNDPLMVNADEMKDELPEYQDMLRQRDSRAAALAHEESSYLAKRLMEAGFENGLSVTLDGTGDSSPASMNRKLDAAHAAGYKVNGFYTTVPTDVAVQRAQARAQKTGRAVPEKIIRKTHASVSKVLPEIYQNFDQVQLFDTTDREAVPIMSWIDGRFQVQSPMMWNQFMAKGAEQLPAPAG
jgi:predicted ABC-type ATPase